MSDILLYALAAYGAGEFVTKVLPFELPNAGWTWRAGSGWVWFAHGFRWKAKAGEVDHG